ncbi:unnamed protein product [Danaus chrysippus]|uniref:(African queen) hypothetical protein n=1 Tax=Danaus chrysippus TaxID=151541 RepID=A0A8J2WA62_9NEOP|nr:unnamed protein product [Danaus chrysippus]
MVKKRKKKDSGESLLFSTSSDSDCDDSPVLQDANAFAPFRVADYCRRYPEDAEAKSEFIIFVESTNDVSLVDFNAHHTFWGCSRIDSRGRAIMDSMDDHDLILLNNGQPTTIGSHMWKPNGLHLTMVSSSLFLSCDWQVHQDPLGSYHLPTITKFTLVRDQHEPSIPLNNIPFHSNLKLVNWDSYEQIVNKMLMNFKVDNSDLLDS